MVDPRQLAPIAARLGPRLTFRLLGSLPRKVGLQGLGGGVGRTVQIRVQPFVSDQLVVVGVGRCRRPRRHSDLPTKMFATCRATVRSESTSCSATSRLLAPVATKRRTSISRGVRPSGETAAVLFPASSRSRSGLAPRSAKDRRAASVARSAVSTSPTLRQACAMGLRGTAPLRTAPPRTVHSCSADRSAPSADRDPPSVRASAPRAVAATACR